MSEPPDFTIAIYLSYISYPRKTGTPLAIANSLMQGDHGGQQLHFLDFIFEFQQYWPTVLQFLPNLQLPKQNWADSGTTKS